VRGPTTLWWVSGRLAHSYPHRMERSSRDLDKFVNGIPHEMHNPKVPFNLPHPNQ
jgi:hypothetical protein